MVRESEESLRYHARMVYDRCVEVRVFSPWSSVPDDFSLEGYAERYAANLIGDPSELAGKWGRSLAAGDHGEYREIRLDLGCGKGTFAIGCALAEPDVLFVGLDIDPVCVAVAARRASEADARNAVFAAIPDGLLSRVFTPGELAVIYLNFSTPHPKGREAGQRLTHASRLVEYRSLLTEGGTVHLRTDNPAFFAYSLGQLQQAGFRVLAQSTDAQAEMPALPETDYERRAKAAGARVHAVMATPWCDLQVDAVPQLPASLYEYLPEDLDEHGYIPPEMARGVAAILRTREQSRRKHRRS